MAATRLAKTRVARTAVGERHGQLIGSRKFQDPAKWRGEQNDLALLPEAVLN